MKRKLTLLLLFCISNFLFAKGSRVSADADEVAGKGFKSEVENKYKKTGNADYIAVDRMEKNSISTRDIVWFISDGKFKGADSDE
ncbi:MAG: hypothetical protein WCR31_08205 [Treponema sp.]